MFLQHTDQEGEEYETRRGGAPRSTDDRRCDEGHLDITIYPPTHMEVIGADAVGLRLLPAGQLEQWPAELPILPSYTIEWFAKEGRGVRRGCTATSHLKERRLWLMRHDPIIFLSDGQRKQIARHSIQLLVTRRHHATNRSWTLTSSHIASVRVVG